MNFKIGDRVRIDKDKAIGPNHVRGLPQWYTEEIFIIIKIENDIITLDKYLPNSGNNININYLKLLKTDRKKKLLKLELLQNIGSKSRLINS